MKLKYYLRGLGTGIAVTALIIGISAIVSPKKIMTDEEVITRAKELGMVERTVLSELEAESEGKEEEPEAPPKKEGEMKTEEESPETEELKSDGEETEEPILEEPEIEVETNDGEERIVPESQTAEFGMPDEAGIVQFSIIRGDSSDSVSRRLEEAGLVDSAVEYDRYLCRNGYDKRIQTGNYDIPANATQEEIAIIITSR